MDLGNIKNHILHKNIQAILLDENGCVLNSDNTLVEIESGTSLIEQTDVFVGMDELINELSPEDEFKLDCIETDFHGRSSMYDFIIRRLPNEQSKRLNLLMVYDLEDVYRKVTDLRQERNDVKIYADKLAHTNAQLKQAQLQLVSSERMATIGLLAAGMSHEINNPLNYIFNGLELLKREMDEPSPDGSKASEMLSIVETGAGRIKEVVDYLKIFDTSGQQEYKEIDLHAAIDQTLKLINYRSTDQAEIVRNYAAEELLLNCSPGKLNQALFNLLINSVTFTRDVNEPRIEIKTDRGTDKLIVHIIDNGVGISRSIEKQVFDPFFTTKKMGTGKGLGLSVANIIIKEHGGELTFESEEGKGTAFCIVLPI